VSIFSYICCHFAVIYIVIDIMKTYRFKFYQHKRNRYLKRTINASASIYNHCIALHKGYYRMFGKTLNCAKLQKHIAKLRNRNPYWQLVGSQAVQDICQRIERGYKLFLTITKKTFSGNLPID